MRRSSAKTSNFIKRIMAKRRLLAGIFFVGAASAAYFSIPAMSTLKYSSDSNSNIRGGESGEEEIKSAPKFIATHVKTPKQVKAIYMTACVAATPSWREKLLKLADDTEINSIVVDIKDYTGTISFEPDNTLLKEKNGGAGCRVKDMRQFIEEAHRRGVYVIGRIAVFQDPHYAKTHPELAVKSLSTGGVWKDHKGLSFIDVGAKDYWDYIIALSRDSYDAGFDELNFDYIRFPSDGNMKDVNYTWSGTTTKSVMLKSFFNYLDDSLSGTGAILSADLFGMTTTNTDDLNIGQILEDALMYFDYVAPMVYPSHYPPNFNGWKNPNQYVYEVVNFSMSKAVERALAASTTPLKLRPWLQDFDYGGNYGEAEVRAQIKATYDAGLTSWMLWDPGNKYTTEAFNKE